MITCFFGVPGVGKTSMLSKIGIRELKRIAAGRSPYDYVLTNFYLDGACQIDFTDFEKYKMSHCLILIDEITMDADNRHFKSFKNEVRDFFILHRHLKVDIIYATQSYDMVDMKIKNLTAELWYMQRSVIPFFRNFTYANRIFRKVNINERSAELTNGYRFSNLSERLFTSNFKLVFRPFYYKYFNSFDEGVLCSRPVLPYVSWNEDAVLPERTIDRVLGTVKSFWLSQKTTLGGYIVSCRRRRGRLFNEPQASIDSAEKSQP